LYNRAVATRNLLATEALSVVDFHCDGRDSRADEVTTQAEIIFLRGGGFCIESARGRRVADPSRVVLLQPGERYRVSHVGPCSDRCLVLQLAPSTLGGLTEILAPARADRDLPLFSSLTHACSRELFLFQRHLATHLEHSHDPLAACETALLLAERLLGGLTAHPLPSRVDDRAMAVQAMLGARYNEPLSLSEIGAAVGLSPFHVARLFRTCTGSSIHQYQLELRLRESIERLADGARDLTGLSLDLGFSDHAHFTRAFKKRFGIAPSQYRSGGPKKAGMHVHHKLPVANAVVH
jgi:AraC-like DNA-binding protein